MAPIRRKKVSISLLIPFAIVALVFGGLVWKKVRDSREVPPVPHVQEPAGGWKAVLFFVADGGRLAREARVLDPCSDTAACIKDLLDELFSGPVGDLDEPIPEGAAVTDVRLEGDLVIVDVTQPFVSDLPVGSSAEMMAVYSIVDTVCVNYPQVARVMITVEGKTASLKHLDLHEPLPPDFTLEQIPAAPPHSPAPGAPPEHPAKKGHP